MPKKLTTEQWVKFAQARHGDRYDYSKTVYTGSKGKVEIVCREHGPFWQNVEKHAQKGRGCPKCSGRGLSTEDWVERFKKAHGDRYDYGRVKFTGARDKVEIVCPVHGPFWQSAAHHADGHGCIQCSGNAQLTSNEWIERARGVHGDRYDYSVVDYTSTKTPVEIICRQHGAFFQQPSNHLAGNGCPICAGHVPPTTVEWVKRAIAVHGDRYDYSRAKYETNKTPIEIICSVHGSFWQIPDNHVGKGKGCAKCAGKAQLTTEEWIERAINVHGDRYDYSKVVYETNSTEVEIRCKEHGTFFQKPHVHTDQGSGCPYCSATGFASNMPGRLYIIQLLDELSGKSYIKVGITNLTLAQRFERLPETTKVSRVLLDDWHETGREALDRETLLKRELSAFKTSDKGFMGAARGYSEIYEIEALPLIESS